MKHGLIIAATVGLLAAAPARADRSVTTDGTVDPLLQGVWQSRGYGWIVRFEPTGPKLFQAVGGFCYPDPRPESDPDEVMQLWRPTGRGHMVLSGEPGGTRYVFDRLPGLPAACADAAPWTASRLVDLVAADFAAFYPRSRERGLDWPARRAAAQAALGGRTDDAALWSALTTLLQGIEDPHLELHGKVGGEPRDLEPGQPETLRRVLAADPAGGERAWLRAYREGVLQIVLKGQGHQAANGRIFWGRNGDLGYLNIVTMGGFDKDAEDDDTVALDAVLDQALAAFAGARAVIVDVSNNRGGYDSISRRIAGRFAERRRLAYSKVAVGADGPPQKVFVEPSSRLRYTGAVYLITSDVTVSAGESFSLLMRALPNVRQVGMPTRGFFSDQIPKPLPNGWTLALPAERYRDPQGRDLEGKGLIPRIRLQIFPEGDLSSGHAKAIGRLMADIRAGRA